MKTSIDYSKGMMFEGSPYPRPLDLEVQVDLEVQRVSKKTNIVFLGVLLSGTLACTGGSDIAEEGARVERLSLDEFREHQEQYCTRLAEELDKPVHWRLVIDKSRSFGFPMKRERRNQVMQVIHALPLEPDDRLTFDTFGGDYQRGGYTLNIQRIHFVLNGVPRLLSSNHLKPLFSDAQEAPPQERTDFLRLVESISRIESDSTHRSYFIILTDGWNQPEGPSIHQPLFADGSRPFAEIVAPLAEESFQLDRGLLFLLDISQLEDRDRSAVDMDWSQGQRILRQILAANSSGGKPWERRFFPEIRFLSTEEASLGIDDGIRQSLDRTAGIFPCLISPPQRQAPGGRPGWRAGRWPTATGYIYPPCPALLEGAPALSLPVVHTIHVFDQLLLGSTQLQLPLVFLARGGGTQRTARIRLLAGDGPPLPFFERWITLSSTAQANGTLPRWAPLHREVSLPLTESDRERHDLPWRVELSFVEEREPFLHLEVSPTPVERSSWAIVASYIQPVWGYLSLRGRWQALMATFLALLASWFSRIARNRTSVHFKIDGEDVRIEPIPGQEARRTTLPWKEMHLAQQLRHRIEESVARLVLRTAGPSLRMEDLKEKEQPPVDIDVTSFVGALYHVAYYLDVKGRPLLKRSHYRLINFGEVMGTVVLPQRSWQPFFTKTARIVPLGYRWREAITLQGFRGDNWAPETEMHHTVETILDEGPLRFLAKATAVFLLYAAFCFASLAIFKVLDAPGQIAWLPPAAILLAAVGLLTKICTFYGSSLRVNPSDPGETRVEPPDIEHCAQPRLLIFKRLRSVTLSFSLGLATYLSFLSQGTVDRIGVTLMTLVGILLGALYWDDLRDSVFRRRVQKKRDLGPVDILLDFFFLRSPV